MARLLSVNVWHGRGGHACGGNQPLAAWGCPERFADDRRLPGGVARVRGWASDVSVSPVPSPIYGRMFWFSRKKFVGSCLRLSARSRSYLASP
jgi:hypothetical protein